ncbi:hypothetical protein HA402_004568 [Bradysia odoriphaga]|nr:hypothetical protein HA402_004568 [Bradysia odoriphaga]
MITHNENISSADDRLVKIAIFFDDHQYLFMRRSEIYGPLTFYAGCAGILSLFMGASFLSVSEILYFVVLRPCWNRRQRQTETLRKREGCKETLKITITMKSQAENLT